jgi:hypothetical protein
MLKNTVMSLPDKFIVFLGRTFSGHNHDYRMLKQELPPELDWFTDIHVLVDLGYLGIQSDYRGAQIEIPTKKPRKTYGSLIFRAVVENAHRAWCKWSLGSPRGSECAVATG